MKKIFIVLFVLMLSASNAISSDFSNETTKKQSRLAMIVSSFYSAKADCKKNEELLLPAPNGLCATNDYYFVARVSDLFESDSLADKTKIQYLEGILSEYM